MLGDLYPDGLTLRNNEQVCQTILDQALCKSLTNKGCTIFGLVVKGSTK
jgi:hypothetical protein